MFRKNSTSEESNFWISYADLMAGLLFVFILLIGAIVSKSIILKSDLHSKEDRLALLSSTLKEKEITLNDLNDTLARSEALIDEKDISLSENKKLITEKDKLIIHKDVKLSEYQIKLQKEKEALRLKNERIAKDQVMLTLKNAEISEYQKKLEKEEEEIQLKNARIAKDQLKLSESERMFKLKISEIEKLNKLLLEANMQKETLHNKIIVVQNLFDTKAKKLKEHNRTLIKKQKKLEEYEGKILLLSNTLGDVKDSVKIKDEKLLVLLNAMDEKKTKYDALLANLQSQKAKIKSLTGIKLKVVSALKEALGSKIDIDKKTGSLRLASNILFDSGEAVLKPEAKIELKRAFEDYIGTLVTNREIKPHLDKIIIEGHTDSVGSYIYNLNLSQKRALAVMEYLLTLDFTKEHNIRPLMIASGRAYLDAIVVNGVEDKEASRRIEIKFRLKNEDAMHEIEKVLDAK